MALFDGIEFEKWVDGAVSAGVSKVKEALDAQPFRGSPAFDDVIAAVEAGTRHAIEVATSGVGSLAARLNALEAKVQALEANKAPVLASTPAALPASLAMSNDRPPPETGTIASTGTAGA